MTCAISVAPAIDALVSLVIRGRERARMLRQPVLVSLAQPLSSEVSPLALFARGPRMSYRTFWGRPDRDFWLVGNGSAAALTSDGVASMDGVAGKRRSLLENAIVEAPVIKSVGPVFLGGFRYDTQVPRDSIWLDFPDALLVLPRFLFTRSEGAMWLTVNMVVVPEVDAAAQAETLIGEFQALAAGPMENGHQPEITRLSQGSPEEWSQSVRSALQAIETGPLYKIVLARRKILYAQGQFSLENALEQLCTNYPGCAVFAVDSGEAVFFGATPESLARVENDTLSVTCLAASAARGSNPEEDQRLEKELFRSQKERREHNAVVAMVTDALGELCPELHWNDAPEILKLKNVQHLRTRVTGNLRPGSGILDVVKRLHPTPATAGVPTDLAMRSIRDIEGDRGWYGAPVGWIDRSGQGEFAVAIRSAILRGDRAVLYAGAGIVKGSDPDQEFQETELKFRPLQAALSGDC